MISKSTRKKPAKPRRAFPLTANGNGQWSKKIKGKVFYFGRWEDPQAALEKYLAEKEYLDAGKEPPVVRDGLRVEDLANRFLTANRNAVLTGELTQRNLLDYCPRLKKATRQTGRQRACPARQACPFAGTDVRRRYQPLQCRAARSPTLTRTPGVTI